jgi:hypothetical protein
MKFIELLSEMESEDKYILSQNAISLGPRLGFLEKQHARPSKAVMRKYISLYHELNGHMEKMTRILLGLKRLTEGEEADYAKMKRETLARQLTELSTIDNYRELISSFSRTNRNAIAHVSVRYDGPNLVLVDNNQKLIISPLELIKQMRELVAAAVVVSHIDNLIFIEVLEYLKNKFKQYGLG